MSASSKSVALLVALLLVALLATQATGMITEPQPGQALALDATATAAELTVEPTAPPTATATVTPSATPTTASTPTATVEPLPVPDLPEEAQTGKAVFIDQATQAMFVFEDGKVVRVLPVSTGRAANDAFTPAWSGRIGYFAGTFTSFGTTQDQAWFLFSTPGGGILIHGNPYVMESGVKVYQELDALGVRPASHGCIRLSPADAKWFSEWQPQGAYCEINRLPDWWWPTDEAEGEAEAEETAETSVSPTVDVMLAPTAASTATLVPTVTAETAIPSTTPTVPTETPPPQPTAAQ